MVSTIKTLSSSAVPTKTVKKVEEKHTFAVVASVIANVKQ